MSPSTAPSYVEDSNPGSLAPESGILPPSHGVSIGYLYSNVCVVYFISAVCLVIVLLKSTCAYYV